MGKQRLPFMGKIFDIVEEGRAEINSKTPFIKQLTVEKDVVYKTVDGEDIVMDIYTPDGFVSGNAPAVLIVPGGGWMIHNRKRRNGYASLFTALGAKVFVIDYRLSPAIKFPENLKDVIDAYNYVVDNKDKYGIDENKIVVTGDSAGGHLSACLGCAATTPGYAEQNDLPKPKTIPAGCIFVSAAFSFDTMCKIPLAFTLVAKPYSGFKTKTSFKKWKYYSGSFPMNHVTSDFPTSYNSGGSKDLFTLGDAKRMSDALNAQGVKNEYFVGKGPQDDHCYILRSPYNFARIDMLKLITWYKNLLKEQGYDVEEKFVPVEKYLSDPTRKLVIE